jgi:hypothetical protein
VTLASARLVHETIRHRMSARPQVAAVHDCGGPCERLRRESSTQLVILDVDPALGWAEALVGTPL